MDYRKYQSGRVWLHLISVPFIWLPLPFIIVLDLVCELYQFICFPIYRIEKVKRSEYILILDRNKLQYLNALEKIGCMYCGYANGFAAYTVKIAGDTEKYWCGIKHSEGKGFVPQPHQKDFLPYGDKKAYEEFVSRK